ncbi:hypothetical protein RHMOL_Rhmol08G0161900 [Rhododendron molle]|uniref:Uncharacterized protein n=1 Tax=Rhododendron molle TaxID=49168 RepID=A0ACC0MP98_RHOML|nr:hypothetical protein RHMOL_Rhmol08G0161900 [Rhododendron molle]
MADHGDGSGEGEVVDRVEDRGGPMGIETGDQTASEGAAGVSAVVAGGGDGGASQQQEVSDEENTRTTEENPHATVLSATMGPIFEAEGSGTVARGPPMAGGSSGGQRRGSG